MAILLLAGPTASGKSALALALAARMGAVVVNADAIQVYDGWRALSARPSPEDAARATHLLYGHVPLEDAGYSVGRWLREASAALAQARAEGRPAVAVGGAGLYFRALTQGLAPIPPTPPGLRAEIEAWMAREGLAAAAAALAREDPETAARADLANPRRVLRALEVARGTGRGLAAWARETPAPVAGPEALRAVVETEPAALDRRIAARLERMAAEGALEEVAAARARAPWSAPGMKALGARALARHLDGEITRAEALAEATLETRRFAKRQRTWFRNQCPDWPRLTLNLDLPVGEAQAEAARAVDAWAAALAAPA